MIHSIGDSHAKLCFEGDPRFITHHLGPFTMYRIGIDGEMIINLKSLGVGEQDSIVWCFGEIDVRNHIIKQRDDQDKLIETIVNALADNYVQMMKEITGNRKSVILAVIPPTDNSMDAGFPRIGALFERVYAREKLNKALERFCNQYHMLYCDPWDSFTTMDGVLKSEMSDNNVHVGPMYAHLVVDAVLGRLK